jgi:glucose/arabinose dehydrogenase
LLILSILAPTHILISYASQEIVNGKILNVERVFLGLDNPTNMAFIGPNDILVLEKNEGTVQRIVNGVMLSKPLLDVNVANDIERGMLGIAVGKKGYNIFNNTYVFLYYTESHEVDGGDPIGNRLYRYELANNKLIHPKLLLDLPYLPGPAHNGGVVTVGPDNNVYIVVGNLISRINVGYVENSLDQNVKDGLEPDGRGGILRVTQDGKVVNGNGILGEEGLLKFYYAYGIRNSFGIAFDPLSGKLWDTENGGYDEINLVEPGFNSGYSKVMGKASLTEDFSKDDLVEFNGKGKYSEPEFTWLTKDKFRVGPTALVFFNSDNF